MEAAAESRSRPINMQLDWARRITPSQAAILLCLVALFVRLIGLTSRPLWLDESFSGWFAERSWTYLWTVVPSFEAHPPFYYSLLKLWLLLAPDSAAGLRSLSVALGIAAVPLLMAAAREQERNDPTGRPMLRMTTVGFLAACSPMLIALDQEARPYPLVVLSYSLATFALLKLLGDFRSGRAGSWNAWLLLAVGTELTLWAHGLGIFYACSLFLALAPAWLRNGLGRQRLVRGAAVGAVVVLAYVPCLLQMANRAHDWGMNWLSWEPADLLQLLSLYTVPIDVMTAGAALAALAMLLLIKRAIDFAFPMRGWNSQCALLVLAIGPPAMAAVTSALFVPVFLERALVGTLAPAYLAIATALAATQGRSERRMIVATLWLTLGITAVQTALRPAMERWDEVASYLRRNASTHDEIWLYPSDSALPLSRTGQPFQAPIRAIPGTFPTLGVSGPIRAGWPAVVSVTRSQAERLANQPSVRGVQTIWLVTRQAGIFDPDGDMPEALAEVRWVGETRRWGYIEVRAYDSRQFSGAKPFKMQSSSYR